MSFESLQQLLDTEMDRKEFLLYIGAVLLSITGIAGLAKHLGLPESRLKSNAVKSNDYSRSAYGG
jgi:hypothetical protein